MTDLPEEVIERARLRLEPEHGKHTSGEMLDDVISALTAEGYMVVPMEPTDVMVSRGSAAVSYDALPPDDARDDPDYFDGVRRIYRAMLAPLLPAPEEE